MEILYSRTPSGLNAPGASDSAPLAAAQQTSVLELTAEEGARLLGIIARAALIRRHHDIQLWLAGELQKFLPHQILVSAWGDFARWDLRFDITSGMHGVRTSALARCRIDDLVRECYHQWVAGGRQPRVLRMSDLATPHVARCNCAIHAALRRMRSLVVHGVRDNRAAEESVYIALNAAFFATATGRDRWLSLIDALVAQIDGAFRKVAPLPLETAAAAAQPCLNGGALSRREEEILAGLACGKTNLDIAAALEISPYTVKNHVQRIFKKIGVRNRTQAATQYQHAVRGGRP
jgi:transcriptional regulator EpsA